MDPAAAPSAIPSPPSEAGADASTTQDQPKKFPKGVVLGKDGKPDGPTATTASRSIARPPSDCPPDVEVLGRSSWTLLHSIAATYPTSPSPSEQSDLASFMRLFSKLYPCWVCAEDFQSYIKKSAPQVSSRDEFGKWLCDAHNDVNRKLGKPVFDCRLWEERWHTGWKDGRCD